MWVVYAAPSHFLLFIMFSFCVILCLSAPRKKRSKGEKSYFLPLTLFSLCPQSQHMQISNGNSLISQETRTGIHLVTLIVRSPHWPVMLLSLITWQGMMISSSLKSWLIQWKPLKATRSFIGSCLWTINGMRIHKFTEHKQSCNDDKSIADCPWWLLWS